MIELEKTFLAKKFPPNLNFLKKKEIVDIYFPKETAHPALRLRKSGSKFEITKKCPVKGSDCSKQIEETIGLSSEEFAALEKAGGKKLKKIRHYYSFNNLVAEFDVFQEGLSGLVLVDFEFEEEQEKDSFQMPDFCLEDVTKEDFIAGGMLCGKSYCDIEADLKRFGYKEINSLGIYNCPKG